MKTAALFPHFADVRIARTEVLPDELIIEARPRAATARCPDGHRRSRHVHSRYTRKIADRPSGERRVTVHLRVRRFRCRVARCPRRTFAEQAPRVLGVDDFALRRGHHYGTVLTDLERRRVLDVLPDRTADTFATWLKEHGQPEFICRDRGGDDASGARQGAPGATPIADRFHLARNSGEVRERVLARHPAALRAAVEPAPVLGPAPDTPVPAEIPAPANPRRERRLARYERVVALREAGWSVTALGREVGLCRATVRRHVHAGGFPERPGRRTKLSAGTAHGSLLQARGDAGCRDATVLWAALRAADFTGSLRMVQRAVARWRVEPGRRGRGRHRRGRRCGCCFGPTRRWCPCGSCCGSGCWRRPRRLRRRCQYWRPSGGWSATATALPWTAGYRTPRRAPRARFRACAVNLRRDLAAVEATLTHEWSSGQVEGQVTKIKLVQRQMYGRANLDLLRKRVLLAS